MIFKNFFMSPSKPLAWAFAALSLLCPTPLLGQGECSSDAWTRGHLGIAIACDCTVSPRREERWEFRSPIVVTAVEREGPSFGKLSVGDTILTVNGTPVFQSGTGARLAALKPGETVRLGIASETGKDERTLVAASICSNDPRAIGMYVPGVYPTRRQMTNEGQQFGEVTERPAGSVIGPVPVPGGQPETRPEGWLGLAFACTGCGWAREDGDASPYWESVDPPIVYAVTPGGPADVAGLRAGDVLLSVDGLSITSGAGGRALGAVRPGQRLALVVRRGREELTLGIEARHQPSSPPTASNARRFAGMFGGVRVEVEGLAPDEINLASDGSAMVIVVRGTRIRLFAP